MTGCYFANPDCLEMASDDHPPRTREELIKAAHAASPNGYLYVTEKEFEMIRKEVGLGYRWCGAFVSAPTTRRSRH